jgi:L-iditol 2-dehydrogenase
MLPARATGPRAVDYPRPVRALVLHGPGDLRLEEAPEPVAGTGEAVVAVEAALTCATDAKMMRAGVHPALGPLPAPLGHEVAGTVIAVGKGVEWPRPGERVVVANSAPCGDCAPCLASRPNLCERIVYLTGAFAERLRVPAPILARNTLPLPEGLPPALAAMTEPLACAVHSARRCGPGSGEVALILGGGAQGQFLAALLSRAGWRVHLADPHPERRERALAMGAERTHPAPADAAVAARLRARLPGGAGAALVVEAVGRPRAWEAAVALARRGGEVLLHGGCPPGSTVTLPTGPLHYDELTVRGSFHHTPTSVREALALLASGDPPLGDLLGPPVDLADVPALLAEQPGVKRPVRM